VSAGGAELVMADGDTARLSQVDRVVVRATGAAEVLAWSMRGER
jgi:hypothetical protein